LVASLCGFATSTYGGHPAGEWFLYWLGRDASEGYVTTEKFYQINGARVVLGTVLEYPQTGLHTFLVEGVDCAATQHVLLSSTDYGKNNQIVGDYRNRQPKYAPFDTPSRIATLFNGVCGGTLLGNPASPAEARRYFLDFDREVRKIRQRHLPRP
jgi:hypothetical protein